MELGIYFDMRNPPQWARPPAELYGETLEIIEQAESSGISFVWLSEHHFFEDGYLPQTLTIAAAIAARTSKIRIGTAVILAPLRPALQIAEEAAIVDILSSGRLELGLGSGYVIDEFEAFEADISKRFSACNARVEEIRDLLKNKVTPKPVQDPMPIWLGYMGPKGAKMAGKLGCGLLHAGNLEPYLQGLSEGGYEPSDAKMSGLMWILISKDPEAAFEKVLPHTAWQLNSYAQATAKGRSKPPRPITVEDLRKAGRKSKEPEKNPAGLQVLTPDEAVDFIRIITKGLPVVEMHSWANIAGMPTQLALEHIELLATQVKPKL